MNPRVRQEIINRLSVPEDDGVWQAVNAFLADREALEMSNAVVPNLDDAARHYNAGRAAGMADAIQGLRALFTAAHTVTEERRRV